MSTPTPLAKKKLQVTGVVQGVGFRPFVYRLARLHRLSGWVLNTSRCVEIEVEGPRRALDAFVRQLSAEAPALARIDSVVAVDAEPQGHEGFAILDSQALAGAEAMIPPDVAACPDCLAEVLDPKDRRHRYPFTNCTNCGPRFTIIQAVPYDRPHTTMARFAMCPRCLAEYQDPEDRRFHAEPTACPACGPRVWLEEGGRRLEGDAALTAAARLLKDGKIVAVKGLGGFHLAADARNESAVAALRERKGRVAKPFALMVRDLAEAEKLCLLGDQEKSLLRSPERPIVLAPRRQPGPIALSVAPGNKYLGLLLPYTPLHFLLLAASPPVLVMTSGNLSEEPLTFRNQEARERLAALADAFLFHDRDIQVPCDDSVVRPAAGGTVIPIRRARGYVPQSLPLPLETPQVILGVGAEQKNTFCLAWGSTALLSQHIGDLDTAETFDYYGLAVSHFQALSRKEPEVLACDLHPLYLSTRYALEQPGKTLVGVQHHHAHVAACLAENGRADQVIGLALDGTGYGPDGTVWGGEVLVAGLNGFDRVGRFAQVRLPGGEAAVRDPRRLTAAYLCAAHGEGWQAAAEPLNLGFTPLEEAILARQLAGGLNSPLTSSAGRLFDAVAAALDICRRRTYEGQPAVELEMAALPEEEGFYPADLREEGGLIILDTVALFRRLLDDYLAGAEPARVSARFHHALARLLAAAATRVRERTGLNATALSGGVFQNARLFTLTQGLLEEAGFEVLYHRATPPNDGCISLGQAAVASARLQGSRK
jgi:hydrogenase maturation protein HypF